MLISLQILCLAQDSKKISDKKSELKQLKNEINRLEDDLKQKTRKEKKSVEMIENINKQNLMLNKLISSYQQQEKLKDEEINNSENKIGRIKRDISKLKESYAKYVVYVYKYGKDDKIKWLFGSESFNQALIRNKYLERITREHESEISQLKDKETELSRLQNFLVKDRDEKHNLTLQKQSEESQLKNKLDEKKLLLASLRNDKESLKKELELKKRAEGDIRQWISKLIENERKKDELRRKEEARRNEEARKKEELRKKEEARTAELARRKDQEKSKYSEAKNNKKQVASVDLPNEKAEVKRSPKIVSEKKSPEVFESFVAKGSLHWPVDNGRIVRRFGENRNSKLNTVTINYGIDIKTGSDASVKVALEGTVSTVNWLPGYGSVLIVTHRNGLRTVYGHLGEIYVSEGARVNSGSIIGKVGESLEGNILHFEVWNERSNQNPEIWLGRK